MSSDRQGRPFSNGRRDIPTWPEANVIIYTDGSCQNYMGVGGWASILIHVQTNTEKILKGKENKTTNNRMEVIAFINALAALKKPCKVAGYSDSQYLVKGVREWLPSWKRNNWKKWNKRPVMNQDIWKALDSLLNQHIVKLFWIPRLSTELITRCDTLAKEEAQSLLDDLRPVIPFETNLEETSINLIGHDEQTKQN